MKKGTLEFYNSSGSNYKFLVWFYIDGDNLSLFKDRNGEMRIEHTFYIGSKEYRKYHNGERL